MQTEEEMVLKVKVVIVLEVSEKRMGLTMVLVEKEEEVMADDQGGRWFGG